MNRSFLVLSCVISLVAGYGNLWQWKRNRELQRDIERTTAICAEAQTTCKNANSRQNSQRETELTAERRRTDLYRNQVRQLESRYYEACSCVPDLPGNE